MDKSVLVLGAGMVAGPLVEYLDSFGIKQTVSSVSLDESTRLRVHEAIALASFRVLIKVAFAYFMSILVI